MFRRTLLPEVCSFAVLISLPLWASDNNLKPSRAVYTTTNAATGNSIMVYSRNPSGSLTPAGLVSTGGKGTGGGLGSQGSLVLSPNGSWLLAVNAASNDVSVLSLTNTGVVWASRTPSGGEMPISVTIFGRIVYVLNAGVPNSISGFTLSNSGTLTPLPGSIRSLSAPSVGPAEVQFSPDGSQLVVTEKTTGLIDVFTVEPNGTPGTLASFPSAGMTPFGFTFAKRGRLLVSEAFGGAPNGSAVSSYNLTAATLHTVSGSIPTLQTSACWVVIDSTGSFAYTTNTASDTVSFYTISREGVLTLDGRLAKTLAGPIDAAIDSNNPFLSVLTTSPASVVTFRIQSDGSLAQVDTAIAPFGAAGLAAQ